MKIALLALTTFSLAIASAWAVGNDESHPVNLEILSPIKVASRAVVRVDGSKGPGGNYQIFCLYTNKGRKALSLKAGTKLSMSAVVDGRGVVLVGKGLEVTCTEEGTDETRPVEFEDESAIIAFRFVNAAMLGKLAIDPLSKNH